MSRHRPLWPLLDRLHERRNFLADFIKMKVSEQRISSNRREGERRTTC
ncbi:MAG: hypothetical protein ACR2QH_03990 [Geminicoccaceae bacterium]